MAEYVRPTQIDEALEALSARPLTVVAGGTDFYPARVGQPLDDDVLDITAIDDLRVIEARTDYWRFPALVTWTNVINADLPPELRDNRLVLMVPSPALRYPITAHTLAPDEVCFVGEAVALIVADDRYIAEDAAELIMVDYEDRKSVV